MTTWAESLENVQSGTATKVQFVDAITRWLGTEIAESTEGMYQAVSRRVVWQFPGNYAFAVGSRFSPAFYHLSEELSENAQIPLPQNLQEEWRLLSKSRGWGNFEIGKAFPTAEKILSLVELFTETCGVPKLILPWDYSWTEWIVNEGEDYYQWSADEDLPAGEINIRQTMFNLATAVIDGTLEKASPWEFEATDDEEAGLSYYSDFSKFKRFVKRVSEEKLAVLALDQHCAGCVIETYQGAVKDDPELEGKERFVTWEQNSENMWLGDGSICIEVSIDNPEVEKRLATVAEEEGLDMGLAAGNWQASGMFLYKSYTLLNQVDPEPIQNLLFVCNVCGAEIGYGFCLECSSSVSRTSSVLNEDEADKIYSCGLALARNGKKLEAIEVWLPLARQGDATTIDAVIVSLWQMGREHGAKTWLTRLAGLDRGQFNSVIARLEIPEEMAKTFIDN
jgi:hypothetical protein